MEKAQGIARGQNARPGELSIVDQASREALEEREKYFGASLSSWDLQKT